MSELVANCARCGANHTTFDVLGNAIVGERSWQKLTEAYCVCRQCQKGTIFIVRAIDVGFSSSLKNSSLPTIGGSLTGNNWVAIEGYVSIKDADAMEPPEYLPTEIESVFNEGARCFAVGCDNAAGAMFRLCVDLATADLLPDVNNDKVSQPNPKQRRDLGLRLPWLFDQKLLPDGLHELSTCIKEDGNDGVHRGSLSKEDIEDIRDFTFILLERLYTEPARLLKAKERRAERRSES